MTRDEIFAALIALIETGVRAVNVGGEARLAVQPQVFEMMADLLYSAVQGENVMARVRRDLGVKDDAPAPAVNAAGIGRA